MSDPDRRTAPQVELIPTTEKQPNPGRRVLAIQHGGCLVQVVWTSRSHLEYDAWMDFPKIPAKVKQAQQARLS